MTAKNDITGDLIMSRGNSKQFEENHSKIFSDSEKRREEKRKADAEYWAKVQEETQKRLASVVAAGEVVSNESDC